jgi:hypothetical protein
MLKRLVLFALLLTTATPVVSGAAESTKSFSSKYAVSLPQFSLKSDELVISYGCSVVSGGILQVKTPYLWHVEVINGDAGRVRLSADVYISDWAFGNQGLSFFDRFLVVGKGTEKQFPKSLYPPFDLGCDVSIGTFREFHNPRVLKFGIKELKLETLPDT